MTCQISERLSHSFWGAFFALGSLNDPTANRFSIRVVTCVKFEPALCLYPIFTINNY
jgi:DNA-binding transcriptional regulator WhiA